MSDIDHLSVGPSLVQAGLRDLSLPGKAPRSRKFKELTLGALNQLAIALKEPNESIPEVSGTTAQKRRTYLDYISARLLPRLNEHNEHNDGHLTDNRASSQPAFGSGRPIGGVAGGDGGGAGLAFPAGIARAASVPPRRTQALKPFLQLFITLDQKVCLIPELRFPIANLLNMKKIIFLPPVNFSPIN